MIDFVASVRNSGTHTMLAIIGGKGVEFRKLPDFEKAMGGDLCHAHTDLKQIGSVMAWAKRFGRVIIPIRDPRSIAISWHIRGRGKDIGKFIGEWQGITRLEEEVDSFLFCMERPPYTELQSWLGKPVHRMDEHLGSRGNYTEKRLSRKELRQLVGRFYKHAEDMVETDPLARRFYA